MMVDFLTRLGADAWDLIWLPMVVWTAVSVLVLGGLNVLPERYVRIHVDARVALLAAIPVALTLATIVPVGGVESAVPVISVPRMPVPPPSDILDSALVPAALGVHFWIGTLTIVAGLTSIAGLFGLMFAWLRLRRIVAHATPLDDDLTLGAVDRIRELLGLRASVRVLRSNESAVPFSTGIFRPAVVLPASLTDLRFDILLHEIVHHRDGDMIRSWITEAVRSAFFFHPLIHFIDRQIRLYVELSCDARVLAHPDVRKNTYAEVLLSYAHLARIVRSSALPMADSSSQLERRIKAMKNPFNPSTSAGLVRLFTLVVFVSSVTLVACTKSDPGLTEADGIEARAQVSEQETFVIVEQNPEPIGGLQGIQARVQYPDLARKAGVEGKVYLQFVVNTEGIPQDIVITRGIGAGCDEAAIEAIRQTRFNPGRQRGKAVQVKMSLPVKFSLDDAMTIAKKGKISGRIVDERGNPVARATVQLSDKLGTMSDEDGYWFAVVPVGTYTATIRYGGSSWEVDDVEASTSVTNEYNVTLDQ